jgi:hypothetical protein
LSSELPNLVAECAENLSSKDRRLHRLTDLDKKVRDEGLKEDEQRSTVVAAIDAAKKASLNAQGRLRAFRNVVLVAGLLAAAAAASIAVVGLLAPDTLPLCYQQELPPNFQPAELPPVCPASGSPGPADSLIVEFAGILGASVAAVFALRKVRGSADPYSIPVALALLKLPTGALTAFLGLLLIKAGFVPGLSALDSSAQIIAWAIVFGYAQELFTSLVDRQALTVLAESPYEPTRDLRAQRLMRRSLDEEEE